MWIIFEFIQKPCYNKDNNKNDNENENEFYYEDRNKNYNKDNIEFRQNKVPSFVPVAINEKIFDKKAYFRDKTPTGIFEEDFEFPAIISSR